MDLVLPTLAPARSQESAAARIERELRGRIIDLSIKPGERLSEAEIAERFQVSRQPVREAFIALMRAGLVDVQPQRGTVVVKLSVRRMLDARFIREAIELAIVRRACEHFDRHYLDRMRKLIDEQMLAVDRNDKEGFLHLDNMFHIALADGAGCSAAWAAVEMQKAHMDRVCALTLHSPGRSEVVVDQHIAIVDAVEAGDAERAVAAMSHHLNEILRAVAGVEITYSDLFE
ncbi:GntR family transcriptional regulator [Phreatobacter aquaticus]|uniref:GntR family transcriptional regulator n=1 Tax=Phreatobacter aquaticus TaxID=2570229 RepID=A0A4D7Q901_9HYPH|nr:GntR family transcriptional regulator [Phreatobacter aquaticus]QCK84610.1 GntR family transcriptional regulator [Phreatobacter aquaticus]